MTYYNFITWYTNGMFIPFFRGFDPQIKGSKWTFFQGNHSRDFSSRWGLNQQEGGDPSNKHGELTNTGMATVNGFRGIARNDYI
jgi:hypothetical protein